MAERDSDPGAMLADKGHDSEAIRHDLRDRGAMPEIPTGNTPRALSRSFHIGLSTRFIVRLGDRRSIQ
jgi:hypothetical protein